MQLFDPKKAGTPTSGLFNAKEKRRFGLMAVGAVVLVIAVVSIQMSGSLREKERLADFQPPFEPLQTEVSVPKIDVAKLEAVAADALPQQRVVLSAEALAAGFEESRQVYDSVYEALGGRELTAALVAQILADPKAMRGQLFRLRCTVEELRQMNNPTDVDRPRNFVRGRLEDGATVYFAVADFIGDAPGAGEFVRMDGLFVRVHNEEIEGQWREAPLFVGQRMVPSFEKRAPVKELRPERFANVKDDSVDGGLHGLDEDERWDLLSYVKNLEPGEVDWNSVPVLDNTTISDIFRDGSPWRCKPVRVPVARMLHVWTQAQPENPLRMETMVEGWFGRGDWVGQAKVARFIAPMESIPPNVRKDVIINAFFYKNLAYTPKNGGAAIAPFFVVESLQEFVAPEPVGLRQLAYIGVGTLGGLGVLLLFLLRRDRARTAELEAELLRRRRERRHKLAAAAKS
jgi:hypothetical protein